MEYVLKVEKLQKDLILREVSFEVGQGEMLAVMGPSGSGKSTLLYQAAGMDSPSGGRVWLKNTEITGLTEDERAKLRLQRMGFVFQQMNMVANLNILDNILLPAVQAEKGRGRQSGDRLAEKAAKLMRRLSISGLEDRRITQVSGGQLQRACICRSMMKNRAVILNMSIQPEDNRIFRTPGKGVLPLPAVPCSIRMSFRSYQLERLRPVNRKERERSAGKSGQAHRTAASGLSETVPEGYIHEPSHKRQAERLSCRH